MGMYTELNCAFLLKKETPKSVIDTLKFMVGESEVEVTHSHRLFETDRWRFMLRCDSYYFYGDTRSTIRFDNICSEYAVTIRTNLKNYTNEIELFIDWMTPYMDMREGEFIGYKRYETTQYPTLIFYPNQWQETEK